MSAETDSGAGERQTQVHQCGQVPQSYVAPASVPATPDADDASERHDAISTDPQGDRERHDAWRASLTEAEQSWGIPYAGRHIFTEQDVERIVAARESAAATRARAEALLTVADDLDRHGPDCIECEPDNHVTRAIGADALRDRAARIARGDA